MFSLPENPMTVYLTLFYILSVVVLTMRIIIENKEPQVAIGWILAFVFVPYVGILFYFLGGVNWKKRKIVRYRPEEVFRTQMKDLIDRQENFLTGLPDSFNSSLIKTFRLNLRASGGIITMNNRCDIYHGGEEAFEALLGDIRKAERFIHMEYFLWRSDSLGEKLASLLLEKAAAGVEVRLIFDGVGCFRTMKRRYRKRLSRGGVEIRTFLDPMNPLSGRLLNYRNHRKIVVIDGRTAYCGGMNIAEEYITGGRRFPSWRDTHFRLRGEAVRMMEAVFLSDWRNSGGEVEEEDPFFPPLEEEGYLPIQVLCSGPDSDWHSIEQFIFNMVCNADREVLIQSPYFIPSESLLSALVTTALSGVRIRFMMTGIPDKRIPFWAAQTYFEPLLEAKVEIYLYQKGFFHPKIFLADDKVATVGTCNMDLRSLHLHYEVNAVFYDNGTVTNLRTQFEKDVELCQQVTLENLRRRNAFIRFRNSLFRIISPVL